jgi:uncharacterized protein
MHRVFVSRFWSRIAVLSLAIAMISLGGCASVKMTETHTQTLTATGKGTLKIPATLAQISLGIEIQGKTAQVSQQEVAKRSEAVLNVLRSSNVEQLQTNSINLTPTYTTVNQKTQITGYIASNTVSFRLPTEKAGDLIDRAVALGANRIESISFVATDEAIETARQQALQTATQDAQKQADAVLTSLNLTRRQIVSIQVNPSTPPPQPINYTESMPAAKDTANTLLVGGEQQVQAFVTLQISY